MGCLLVAPLVAQNPVRLSEDTPLLKEPRGVRLLTLVPGVRVTPGRSSNEHSEVTIQGWIFTASTQPDRREGFDLSVKEVAGENLRAAPDGPVLARAVQGSLFHRIKTQGGWTQVRRTGWIARSLLTPPARVATRPAAPAPAPAPAAVVPTPARESASAAAALPPDTVAAQRRGLLRAGAALRSTQDGPAVSTLAEAAEVNVVARDREWVKVELTGWVRATDVSGGLLPPPAITAAMLQQSPDKYVGQTVDWRVQFLAHQQADELRPEMPLGHPYLLARGPLPETGFVYILVSKEQDDRLKGLKPLDELSVMVTVRAARTRYLATPVVEMVRLGADARTP